MLRGNALNALNDLALSCEGALTIAILYYFSNASLAPRDL